MFKHLVLALALAAFPASAMAQSTTAVGQTQTQNQVTIQSLPPAATCFNCECNNTDFTCRTACMDYTDLIKRQQCEAACGQTLSTCLANAQKLQRAVDEQRALTQQSSASGRTN
ncbi:hypothetical protein NNJEOMEG_00696 [Fundidesulfovibrio magnetotacticus]|uniref:Uncharacterized protein n=1 Tax=Fundidesulfovibrio magnetotacticus TaxID=2730080 RepID=A0A6V8LRA3_9BACT|nr:hypothetical protein [Fundidesulfovibrio magnetotacticus]GFK92868.1 hypothetical protein NNJEOMEG_00696 [Fundidesulfovibrio magnetotacticus]